MAAFQTPACAGLTGQDADPGLLEPMLERTLYLVSLAERVTQAPTEHSIKEIGRRIAMDLAGSAAPPDPNEFLQFQLVFVHREGNTLLRETLFVAPPRLFGDMIP